MPTYYDEATKTWYCKFYYTDYTGTKKQKKKRGFKLQRDAKQWEASFISSLKFDDNTTFGQIYDKFVEENTPRRKVTTMRAYSVAMAHVLPTFKDVPISSISEEMLVAWQNAMLTKDISDVFRHKIDSMFRTIYRFGIRRCKVPHNAFDELDLIGKTTSKKLDFWTLDEYKAFIPYITNPDLLTAFDILFYCGLRLGELMALTAGDIDLENKVMHITKSLQRVKRQDIVTSPKTESSIRDITLPDFLVKELENYLKMFYDCNDETRLFTFSKQTLYYPMKKYSAIAGLKKIRIHDLRHSHVALLIEKNVSPMAIAERLGHENIKITLGTYGHLYPNKQKEIASLLDNL